MTIAPFAAKDFNLQFQRSLAKAYLGAASSGEVLAVADAIQDGDTASWHQAWRQLGADLQQRAEQARTDGQVETAYRLFLRAGEAWRQAGFFHRGQLDCDELQSSWPRAEACFQAFMTLTDYAGQALRIPFEGGGLYGYLARPDSGKGPWKTLLVPSGYDSTVEEMLVMVGLPALARGYAVLAVDGPGQGKTLYDSATRAFMRPDYKAVLESVIGFALGQPGVDPKRLAAVGTSLGGYLVPSGAAGETRLAAMVTDPGLFDIGATLLSRLPPLMIERLNEDSAEARELFEDLLETSEGSLLFRPRMAAHGVTSVQAYCRQMVNFHNRDAAQRITCPSLICDNEKDPIFAGQGQMLANAMTRAAVTFRRFTEAEGAGGHCEGLGREVFDERVFAWLDGVLG